jgi:16S rRNA (adenine1518-N6/adenine1519-N6)-dimethyltransferase
VRATLARRGLRAHKTRGQNFLVDPRVAEQIADWARLGPEELVVEVGPGLGILTRALASRAGRVVAIEIDRGLVEALREEGSLPENVELLHRDALDVDLLGLLHQLPGRAHVVANLPYSISAPLLRWLLGARAGLTSWLRAGS